jgi:hypothetical protein
MTRDGGQRGTIKEDARAGCMYVTSRPMACSSVASPCSYESFALDDTRYVARANLARLACTDCRLVR